MTADLSQYRELYIQTAKELIKTLRSGCEALNNNGEDSQALENVHRAAHSLKSQSLVMGYPQMGLLNKQLEGLFLLVIEKKVVLSPDLLERIKNSIISIEYSLEKIEKTHEEADLKPQIEDIEQITHINE